MRFRLERVVQPRVDRFHRKSRSPFDFFFLVSDNLHPSQACKEDFVAQLGRVAFFRCDQRPDDPVSMAGRLIPDYNLLDPVYPGEFDAVLAASKRIAFSDRLGMIAWRGRLSGPGYPDITNCSGFPRYQLLRLPHAQPDLVHARITDDSNLYGTPERDALRLEIQHLFGSAEDPWPCEKFVRYKYLISLDGAVAAWKRVPTSLASGSVLLLQADWQQYFYPELRPWHNYVPVSRDLSDLLEHREWLEAHPSEAREIGANGQNLALARLTPEAIEQRFLETLTDCSVPKPV
jgi:hypothetical protein